ncbi:hypothetical protein CTTA_3194 [Comamonas testosteroni]|uniref:Uncharacterized protein n=1 Tax=Comamonas testosteroni TaxID=285 RepID=A0A5A7MH35_COMTE|nr:hypothetical protein CTTA_3194 [Comamonas testosteroni]
MVELVLSKDFVVALSDGPKTPLSFADADIETVAQDSTIEARNTRLVFMIKIP